VERVVGVFRPMLELGIVFIGGHCVVHCHSYVKVVLGGFSGDVVFEFGFDCLCPLVYLGVDFVLEFSSGGAVGELEFDSCDF
jgi:hypothetical protein